MYQGFYTIAAGVLMQQRNLDVLSNNLVNANTPGYKASRLVSTTFDKELLRVENDMRTRIGGVSVINIVSEEPTRFDSESLLETGRGLDMAINGEGFFRIQAPGATDENGEETEPGTIYLTRNGNFALDAEGYLELEGYGRVLGQRGEIYLKDAEFTVQEDGSIYDVNGSYVDTLSIVVPGEGEAMERADNALFRLLDGAEGQPATEFTMVQNWLERSNIDPNREYTLIMEAQRAFQACSTALQIADRVNQKAAQQIASL